MKQYTDTVIELARKLHNQYYRRRLLGDVARLTAASVIGLMSFYILSLGGISSLVLGVFGIGVVVNFFFYLAIAGTFIIIVIGLLSLREYGVYLTSRIATRDAGKYAKLQEWQFQGVFAINDKKGEISITDSDAGCILKDRTYKNFTMDFDFKVANKNGFGLIYRARDLNTYLMLKIQNGEKIGPHFRSWRGWEILQAYEPNYKPPAIHDNTWQHMSLSIRDNALTLLLDGNLIYKYCIPSHAIMSHLILNPVAQQDVRKIDVDDGPVVPTFRERGAIGFRAANTEKVCVRNLVVKS